MMKGVKVRKRKSMRLRVDLSEWEMNDWPNRLREKMRIRIDDRLVKFPRVLDFEFDFDEVAREIATEAIEQFLHDIEIGECAADLTSAGIMFEDLGLGETKLISRRVTLSMDNIFLNYAADGAKALERWGKKLNELREQWKDDTKPEPGAV